jgi:hypothetical protein
MNTLSSDEAVFATLAVIAIFPETPEPWHRTKVRFCTVILPYSRKADDTPRGWTFKHHACNDARTTERQQFSAYNARVQRPPANALKGALYRSRSACNELLARMREAEKQLSLLTLRFPLVLRIGFRHGISTEHIRVFATHA